MKQNGQYITTILIIACTALLLSGCFNITNTAEITPTAGTPTPGVIKSPIPVYANAQATIDYGKSQLLDLSRKATDVSLNMTQAAKAAALTTLEFNRRQKVDLDNQATAISLNITQAAATQEFIVKQTRLARDATTAAQSSAATAAQSDTLMKATQTGRAKAVLDSHDLQTAQAVAAMTAYPLTATPYAVTQAALLKLQYSREQKSFADQIVAPLIPIIATLDLILLILVIVVAYRQFISNPRRHLNQHYRVIPSVLLPPKPPPELPSESTVNDE